MRTGNGQQDSFYNFNENYKNDVVKFKNKFEGLLNDLNDLEIAISRRTIFDDIQYGDYI